MIIKENIDEAIKHCEEVAEKKERDLKVYESLNEDRPLFTKEENECKECAKEHEQLAEWLKELKQLREQEPCEDVISRQAVVYFLRNHAKDFEDVRVRMSFMAASSLVENVDNVPSVIPVQKKGKWKWEEDWTPSTPVSPAECNYAGWVCSECGEFPDEYTDWDNPDEKPTYEYCPNCGSEMREEERQ